MTFFNLAEKGGSEDEESSSAIKIVGPVIVVVIFVFVAGIGLFFFTKFYCGRAKFTLLSFACFSEQWILCWILLPLTPSDLLQKGEGHFVTKCAKFDYA